MNRDHPAEQQYTPLQKAAIALKQMRARLEASEQSRNQPIAIVGMACRLPGAIDSPAAFWRALVDGDDLLSPVPPQRWDAEALYHPTPATPGKSYVRHGYFVRGVDQFDPFFFEMSPREAKSLDPQQRLLLEASWQALNDAQLSPQSLANSQTGVFIGIGQNDYAQRRLHGGDVEAIGPFDGTGNGLCFAAGRISHWLGLQGPNLAIDTACSSSLVALHLACQSLRLGECGFALAGGVQLMLSPHVNLFLSQSKALAPDGRSKAFDAAADGFGRGEGCAMVALKRLADAQRDGDRVLAVVQGSAVNHDGPSSGLTVPNGQAQQAVMREALRVAGATPEQVRFVEAHGTGTRLGDPIEVRAIDAVYGKGRERPLWLSSVKANIGHLEAAAGVAALIKTVLCLQNQQLPRQLLFKNPSPQIDWDHLNLRVADHQIDLSGEPAPRLAGISSFGISGANCHVILSEADSPSPGEETHAPPLPFQRKSYWIDDAAAPRAMQNSAALLERLVDSGEFSEDEQRLLPKVVDALGRLSCPDKNHLLEITWREQTLPTQSIEFKTPGAWLLLSDAGGTAEMIAQRLKAHGQRVALLPDGGGLDQALDELAGGGAPLRGVVHCVALDAPPTGALTPDALEQSHGAVCLSMLRLLQTLARRGYGAPPRVWALTRNAIALPGDKCRVSLAQAPLRGLGKTAAIEHPELWGGLIDLDASSASGQLDALLCEWTQGARETEIALRPSRRYVARLAKFEREAKRQVNIQPDGTYWILGGLGALGLRTAEWLVQRGARTLVLTSRRSGAESAALQLETLRSRGAAVYVWRGDVCDAAAVREMAVRINRELPPLLGAIHAAGEAGYQPIPQLDGAQLKRVMRAKTVGAFNLMSALQDQTPGFIAFYSSIASVWGSKNQAHYAAANHFLDALACDAAHQGQNACAVNWGPWPGGGMATGAAREQLAQMGITPLPFAASFKCLLQALSSGVAQVVAANVDWPRLSNLFEIHGRQRFFDELLQAAPQKNAPPPQSENGRAKIKNLPVEERVDALTRHVQTIVAELLGYDEGRLPDANGGFFQLGMDSLLAVDLKDRLVRSLGVSLAAPAVFSYPNARDLAVYLCEHCLKWQLDSKQTSASGAGQNENQPQTAPEPSDDALAQKLAHLESLINDGKS